MTPYQFTVIVASVPTAAQVHALLALGDGTRVVRNPREGIARVRFRRHRPDLADAVVSAVRDVEAVGLRAVRLLEHDWVTLADVADRVGRSREAVRLWSVLIASLLIPLAFVLARDLSDSRYIGNMTAMLTAFFPGIYPDLVRVSNDALAVPLATAVCVALVRYCKKPSRRGMISLGALLAAGLATKAFFIPILIAVLVLMLLPKGNASAARKVAMITAVMGLLVAVAGFIQAAPEIKLGKILTVAKTDWVPSLGIEYHLAADGVSLTLALLTGLAAVGGILFSWNIEHRGGLDPQAARARGHHRLQHEHRRQGVVDSQRRLHPECRQSGLAGCGDVQGDRRGSAWRRWSTAGDHHEDADDLRYRPRRRRHARRCLDTEPGTCPAPGSRERCGQAVRSADRARSSRGDESHPWGCSASCRIR